MSGIVERGEADLADERSTSLPTETSPAKPTPLALPRDISAPIMVPECEPTKMRPTGMSGSAKAALAVSITPSRRLTTPRLDGPTTRMPVSRRDLAQPLLARGAVRAGLGEARRQDGGDLHAGPAAFGDRVDHGLGRHQDVGVVRRLGQGRDGRPGALAQHGLAPRIDRIDRAAIARLAQEIQRPAGGLRGIVGLADSATERGDSSACRSAARSFGVIGIRISAGRNGEAAAYLQIFRPASKPSAGRPVIRRAIAHDNVRIGVIPILRVGAICSASGRWCGPTFEGETDAQIGFGVAPIATALVGLGVVVFASHVRAGGDKVEFPEGFDKGVLYTTVDRADNKQYRELYTSQAAVDAAKKGEPMPDGTVITLVQYKAKLDADGNPEKDANGRFIKTDLLAYTVMEKRKGWGTEYPREHPQRRVGISGLHGRPRRRTRTPSSPPASSATSRCRRRATSCSRTARWRGSNAGLTLRSRRALAKARISNRWPAPSLWPSFETRPLTRGSSG